MRGHRQRPWVWPPWVWLPWAWLPWAWLPGAWLPGAWLPWAWLPWAWLAGAWLAGAWLPGVLRAWPRRSSTSQGRGSRRTRPRGRIGANMVWRAHSLDAGHLSIPSG
ncbi:MAG: hypothetical protein CSB49_08030 [Proteobacteria bacterium]|nr:MAG: hypothetical protein CSB49_08030 [Pseudomonadota bacterium]